MTRKLILFFFGLTLGFWLGFYVIVMQSKLLCMYNPDIHCPGKYSNKYQQEQ
jgi:hypothetical protein